MARTSPRRVSLPAADDLFRPTDPTAEELAAEAHARRSGPCPTRRRPPTTTGGPGAAPAAGSSTTRR